MHDCLWPRNSDPSQCRGRTESSIVSPCVFGRQIPFFVPRTKLPTLRDEGKASENIFTHAELPENVEAAQRAGEAMEKAVNSGSFTAFQEKGPLGGVQEALAA